MADGVSDASTDTIPTGIALALAAPEPEAAPVTLSHPTHHHRPRMTVPLPTLIPAPQGPAPVTVIPRRIRKPSEAFPEYHASPRADLWRSRHARHRPALRLKFPTPPWVLPLWLCILTLASGAAGFAYGFRAGVGTWTP